MSCLLQSRVFGTIPSNAEGLGRLAGFGNIFSSEAIPHSLPRNQNSPQKVPYGLYAEQLSGSAFTVARKNNKWLWTYRIRPSVLHTPSKMLEMLPHPGIMPPSLYLSQADPAATCKTVKPGVHPKYTSWLSPPFVIPSSTGLKQIPPPPPIQLRYKAMPNVPNGNNVDFIDGVMTMASNGDPISSTGSSALVYSFNTGMSASTFDLEPYGRPGRGTGRYLCNCDGEMLFVPYEGVLRLKTETGIMDVPPTQTAVIPRGMKFKIDPAPGSTQCKGYICENFGSPFVLPELGPIGSSSGLASARHFFSPDAAFEDSEHGPCELITKYQGRIWAGILNHSPLDVVSWYGNYVPYQYDLKLFNCINSVSFDHPDPSIYTVLTSPGGMGSVGSGVSGVANVDFVVFPPRWICMENTFRPPWFHRNYMSELMGLISGEYDAKQDGGFTVGAMSVHNSMVAHGPDSNTWNQYTNEIDTKVPQRYSGANLAFMFESSAVWRPTILEASYTGYDAVSKEALSLISLNYSDCWSGIKKTFDAQKTGEAKRLSTSMPLQD